MKLRVSLFTVLALLMTYAPGITDMGMTDISKIQQTMQEKTVTAQSEPLTINDGGDSGGTSGGGGDSANESSPPVDRHINPWTLYLGTHKGISFIGNNIAYSPSGYGLTITNAKADPNNLVNLSLTDGTLFIAPVELGTATITATVSDGHGGIIDCMFQIIIKPTPEPVPIPIGNLNIKIGDTAQIKSEDLAKQTEDSPTRFVIEDVYANPSGIIDIRNMENSIYITGINEGSTTVTASVYNIYGRHIDNSFNVTVTQSVYGN